MTNQQWEQLVKTVQGELLNPMPVGFIIDSPWLPGWAGISILDYYTSERLWLETNFKVVQRFPDVMFIPGFWSEFGMCTEPAAFGARCVWPENEFPFAEKSIFELRHIDRVRKPNCRTDGLCPFVIKRLEHRREMIEEENHAIRFAVSRGPHNIASFLLGHTEFLIGLKEHPQQIKKLLAIVTEFVVDWLAWQAKCFSTIDGILVLDDLIGFLGEDDFCQFALPYFEQIGHALDVTVRILHNDSRGLITAKYLRQMGFNVFNFSFEHTMPEMRRAAGDEITLLGNIPPRDVLAAGSAEDVKWAVADAIASLDDHRRVVWSCGGGMPPNVPTANIDAFSEAVAQASPGKAG